MIILGNRAVPEAADILACLASQPEYFEGGHDWTWQLVQDTQPAGHPIPIPLKMSTAGYYVARRAIDGVLKDFDANSLTWREMYAEAEARIRSAMEPK